MSNPVEINSGAYTVEQITDGTKQPVRDFSQTELATGVTTNDIRATLAAELLNDMERARAETVAWNDDETWKESDAVKTCNGVKALTHEQQSVVDYLRDQVFGARIITKGGISEQASFADSLEIFTAIMKGQYGPIPADFRLLFSALNSHFDRIEESLTVEELDTSTGPVFMPMMNFIESLGGITLRSVDGDEIMLLEISDFAMKLAQLRLDGPGGYHPFFTDANTILSIVRKYANFLAFAADEKYIIPLSAEQLSSITAKAMYAMILANNVSLPNSDLWLKSEPALVPFHIYDVPLTQAQWAYIYCMARVPVGQDPDKGFVRSALRAKHSDHMFEFNRARLVAGQIKDWHEFEERYEDLVG